MKYGLSLVFLFVSTHSWAQQQEFNWLVGTWREEHGHDNKSTFEVWKNDSGSFYGESYEVQNEKKIITEEIKLIKKGNDFCYVPDVAGPQGPVEFRLTSFYKNSFTVENSDHDFPKKIIYKMINEQKLVTTISGGDKSISYSFKKIK